MAFISFFFLLFALTKTSSAMLNRIGETKYPCLFPDLWKKAYKLFAIKYDASCESFREAHHQFVQVIYYT